MTNVRKKRKRTHRCVPCKESPARRKAWKERRKSDNAQRRTRKKKKRKKRGEEERRDATCGQRSKITEKRKIA